MKMFNCEIIFFTPPFKFTRQLPALASFAFSTLLTGQAWAGDSDRDGVDDLFDNCLSRSNPDQRDSNEDGYGNACDPDLNNDGIVNSVDLGLFKNKETSFEDKDFNGDGRVDSRDLEILRSMFLRPPGPSRVAPDPRFINNPPTASRVEFFQLEAPGPKGENGAIRVHFENGPRDVISFNHDGVKQLNDVGVAPDAEPGDGVFSAFLHIDFDSLRRDEEAYIRRLDPKFRTAVDFSGRDVVFREEIDIPQPTPPDPDKIIEISPGVRAILVPNVLAKLPILPVTTDPGNTLAINTTSVVSHPTFTFDPCDTDGTGNDVNSNAVWSFKTLMAGMAFGAGMSTQDFIHEWLANWLNDQTVNSFLVPERDGVLDFFPGWDGVNAATLDVDNLPFRLLAIMNRLDLAQVGYSGAASTGEIRFVFGLLDPVSCSPAPIAERMTVIFEYEDPANSCSSIKARAQEWIDLDSLTLGSTAYMNALKAITDNVTPPNAAPSKPNGSALNQLRTNDFAFEPGSGFGSGLWELREFRLQAPFSTLQYDTLNQTPDATFRTGNLDMAQFMEQEALAILCEQHEVPASFLGNPFLAGSIEYGSSTFWVAPTNPALLPAAFPCTFSPFFVSGALSFSDRMESEVRHKFSLNTCDDCHSGETNTNFVHVDPTTRNFSGFLTGIVVNDPLVGTSLQREFDDLTRRGEIVESLAARGCFGGVLVDKFIAAHSFVH